MKLDAHGGDLLAMASVSKRDPASLLDFSVNVRPEGAPEFLRAALVRANTGLAAYPSPNAEEALAAAARRYGLPAGRFAFGNGLLMAGEKLMGSECRLWSVARTQSQIKFNMYRVNPESEGLLAYWRFDEGEGREFANLADPEAPKAYLAKSISAAAQPPYTGEPEWVHGVRSDEN